MQHLKENWLVLSKDFVLESKMAELNWKQNLLIYFENYQGVPNSDKQE